MISDWFHYAILSLLELPDSKFESRWISKRLGISILDAKLAIDRLQRLGLVEKNEAGRWQQAGKPLKIENSLSTAATRKFHKQLLVRASESIDKDPIGNRDFSSTTFAMAPALIPYARQRIQKFRRELTAELESKGTPETVYFMTVQMFPVSPVPIENSEKFKEKS
jgi:uncharacterized protein (TIGR02147 family)